MTFMIITINSNLFLCIYIQTAFPKKEKNVPAKARTWAL